MVESKLSKAVNSTKASDWKYVAEGAANLIVCYDPPPSQKNDPTLTNKCLRLHKRSINSSIGETSATRKSTQDEFSFLDFYQKFICALINPNNLLQYEAIELSQQWLHELSTFMQQNIPDMNKNQSCIDTQCLHSVLMENLTLGQSNHPNVETVSIEIKPKWSFLPQIPQFLDPTTREIKTKFCRTCVFRAVRANLLKKPDEIGVEDKTSRAHDGVTVALNNYYISQNRFCSLQLFEGQNPNNLLHALTKLYQEWKWKETLNIKSPYYSHNTQIEMKPHQNHNNFKVFCNGVMLNPISTELDHQTIELFSKGINQSNVLRRIDFLQRRLDPINIEGVMKCAKDYTTPDKLEEILNTTIRDDEFEEIISLLSENIEAEKFQRSYDLLSIRKKVIMYGLSMTFKDCSIFIRLPINKSFMHSKTIIKPHVGHDINTDDFLVKVIDLDLKPLSRLKTYFKNDHQIFEEFKRLHCKNYDITPESAQIKSEAFVPITCDEICNSHVA